MTLTTCDDGHPEICYIYEGRECPLCSRIKEQHEQEKEYEAKLAALDGKLLEASGTIDHLRELLEQYA